MNCCANKDDFKTWLFFRFPSYIIFNYHTRAIITRILYTFYTLFEAHLCTVTFDLMYG